MADMPLPGGYFQGQQGNGNIRAAGTFPGTVRGFQGQPGGYFPAVNANAAPAVNTAPAANAAHSGQGSGGFPGDRTYLQGQMNGNFPNGQGNSLGQAGGNFRNDRAYPQGRMNGNFPNDRAYPQGRMNGNFPNDRADPQGNMNVNFPHDREVSSGNANENFTSELPRQNNTCQTAGQPDTSPESSGAAKKTGGLLSSLDEIKIDREKAVIILLIIILARNGADVALIMALGYLLM